MVNCVTRCAWPSSGRLIFKLGGLAPASTRVLQTDKAVYQVVRYAESRYAVSAYESRKQRVIRREAWGSSGMSMARAMGIPALLAEVIPMLFMGEEVAEDQPLLL